MSTNKKAPRKGASARQEGGSHYKAMGVEPWDVVDTWSVEERIGFYRGNAVKYLMRLESGKNDRKEELAKAKHYIEKLEEVLG